MEGSTMKKLVLLLVVVGVLAAGCITLGPKGELQPMPVTLIGKLHQDAAGK
jgi:hypothetical protein